MLSDTHSHPDCRDLLSGPKLEMGLMLQHQQHPP